MPISISEVERVAKLARIELSDEEKKKFSVQLSVILDYVAQLQEVDTTNVQPTAQVTGLENITRVDSNKPADKITREKILKASPNREGDFIKVKAVFE